MNTIKTNLCHAAHRIIVQYALKHLLFKGWPYPEGVKLADDKRHLSGFTHTRDVSNHTNLVKNPVLTVTPILHPEE